MNKSRHELKLKNVDDDYIMSYDVCEVSQSLEAIICIVQFQWLARFVYSTGWLKENAHKKY